MYGAKTIIYYFVYLFSGGFISDVGHNGLLSGSELERVQLRFLKGTELSLETMGDGISHGKEITAETGAVLRAIKTKSGYGWKTTVNVIAFKIRNKEDRIFAYTARVESGRPTGFYDACASYDTAGAYFGILQWSAHAGNLQELLFIAHDLDPELYLKYMENFIPVKIGKFYGLIDGNGKIHDLVDLRDISFCLGLVNLAKYDFMQKAQIILARRWLARVKKFGLKSGLEVLLSLSVALGFSGVKNLLAQVSGSDEEKISSLKALVKEKKPKKYKRISL